ncbi:MAG: response regulator transcription factor [Myxococcota bacterium]
MPKTARQERVLVVEDDPVLRMSLRATLRSAGFDVHVAATGPEGRDLATANPFDLVLLDVMLPGLNGFEVLSAIRDHDVLMPIMMVTAKGDEEDKVRGLGLGADDYIVKPFGVAELLARVEAALRRQRHRDASTIRVDVGIATADFAAHVLERDGAKVEVTAQEMKLLRYLVERDGMLVTRQQILDAVWGTDYFGTERTVDNFIGRLRSKVERNPKRPRHILTVRGAGYRFDRRGSG